MVSTLKRFISRASANIFQPDWTIFLQVTKAVLKLLSFLLPLIDLSRCQFYPVSLSVSKQLLEIFKIFFQYRNFNNVQQQSQLQNLFNYNYYSRFRRTSTTREGFKFTGNFHSEENDICNFKIFISFSFFNPLR